MGYYLDTYIDINPQTSYLVPGLRNFTSGHSLVADDDFAVVGVAENLEAFPQHVLGHAARQVVDVKHLAVVLATGKPWQQSGQRTRESTNVGSEAGRLSPEALSTSDVHLHSVCCWDLAAVCVYLMYQNHIWMFLGRRFIVW